MLQDADRLDAPGAIGVARCITVGALPERRLYDPADPLTRTRTGNDSRFTIDHFFSKLLHRES